MQVVARQGSQTRLQIGSPSAGRAQREAGLERVEVKTSEGLDGNLVGNDSQLPPTTFLQRSGAPQVLPQVPAVAAAEVEHVHGARRGGRRPVVVVGGGRGGGLGGRRWHRAAGLCADLGLLAGAPGAGLQLAARDPGVLHALRDFLLGQAYWPQVDLAAQPWVSRRQGDHREVETRVECLDVPDGRPHVVQQPPQSDLAGRRPAHQHPRGGAQEALHEFVREPEGQDLGQDDRWGEGKEQGARRRRYLPGERRFRVQVLPGEGAPRAGALGRGRRRHVEE
mmetsp:Transcript_92679/g.299813  ORF Transcript_92679/g.299813 Transcript_92679/m.299813 type:complete len:280 (+) Transcript_92679:808-1647(+)